MRSIKPGVISDGRRSRFRLAAEFLIVLYALSGCTDPYGRDPQRTTGPDTIRVVELKYFPVHGDSIDIRATGDWGESLAFTRRKVDSVSSKLVNALSEGTRYHGYADPAVDPALVYSVVDRIEYLEPLPTRPPEGDAPPMTDYAAILGRLDARRLVERYGVDEFWIWGYHGGVLNLWESNMAGPYGDVSNSDRRTDDLPVFSRTYTVYHYNYQRGAAEAMENHMHQLEAVLNHFDGRDSTAAEHWQELLFWGRFVGSDSTHRLLEPIRAGWSHYPPNALHDYEWANERVVRSDIRDWHPDGLGEWSDIDCTAWKCDHLGWFVFWTQNMPGIDNGLSVGNRPLRNWWTFLSDVDAAFSENRRLWK